MDYVRGSIEAPHCLAVIGELGEVHVVVSQLESARQAEIAGDLVFILGKRLSRLGDELFVEVTQRRIHPGPGIARNLIAVGICPFEPETSTENRSEERRVGKECRS